MKKIIAIMSSIVLVATLLAGCFPFGFTSLLSDSDETTESSKYFSIHASTRPTTAPTEPTELPEKTEPPETTEPKPTLSIQEVETEYKAACEEIDYITLARNPDKYKSNYFTFTGEVIQVLDGEYETILRINVTPSVVGGNTHYSDTIYAEVYICPGDDRILEGDIITIWGNCSGLVTYQTIFGSRVSLPGIDIRYYEIVDG